ncbi:DUF5371 family protein [Methanococcoides sp. FTZ1]|uniref:DUF5371 family protein n=1 Tax=Methanococcoides sp. FTZ1 TaxID=3439061 RepID=UPI003F83AB9E
MKIVHAQTVLAEEQLIELKKKSGESSTKDALSTAVKHYLECEYTDMGEDMWVKKMEKIVQKKKEQQK